ncbi:MAG: hypothetical protein IJK89_09685 [Clostridia bacterium]|nr:hypothetical protein [Clostridia bacterium]
MKYYLSIDGGGTKTAAVLYDENFQRLAVCVTGSVRANTTDDALIRKHIHTLIETLRLPGLTVEECVGVCDGRLTDAIKSVCAVKRFKTAGELELGLAAAGIFGDGVLALCGTGATVFARLGEKTFVAGGYGAAVADEGSGYYVGRAALIAAIRDSENRGASTALTDLLPLHFGYHGREELRRAVFSIYGRADRSPAACVAGCAPVVVKAAEQGDDAAAAILTEAGRLLGEQTRYLIEANGLPDELPIALSGSMWRGNPILFDAFREAVFARRPARRIVLPKMEPVLGVLARKMYETERQFTEKSVQRLLAEFPEFAFDIHLHKNRDLSSFSSKNPVVGFQSSVVRNPPDGPMKTSFLTTAAQSAAADD